MIYEMIKILIIKIQAAQYLEGDSLTTENNEKRIDKMNIILKSTTFQIDESRYDMNNYETSIVQTESPEQNRQNSEEILHNEVDQPLNESLISSSCMNNFLYIDEDSVSHYANLEPLANDSKQHSEPSKIVTRLDLEPSTDDFYDVTDILESITCETSHKKSNSEPLRKDYEAINKKVSLVVEDATKDGENLSTNSKMDPIVLDELYVSFLLLGDSKNVKAGQSSKQEQMPDIINSTNSFGRASILKVSKENSEQPSPEVAIFGYKPTGNKEVKRSKCVKFEDSKVKEPKKKKSRSSCCGCFLRRKRNHLGNEEFDWYKKNYVY